MGARRQEQTRTFKYTSRLDTALIGAARYVIMLPELCAELGLMTTYWVRGTETPPLVPWDRVWEGIMGISASLHSFYGLDQSEGESWRSPPRASSHRVIISLPTAHWAPLTCWKLSSQYWAVSLNMHVQLPCIRDKLSRKASPVRKRLLADY